MHEVRYLLGLTDPGGWPYLWWSGIGLALIAGVGRNVQYARHHNCHTKRCWRLGHPHEGVVKCRKHLDRGE